MLRQRCEFSDNVSSLRDSIPFLSTYPALKRWAKFFRPSGASSIF